MQQINIITACDEAFAQHNCVLLASILAHHPHHKFEFYTIVPKSFSVSAEAKTRASLRLRESALHFCRVNDDGLQELRVYAHVTLPSYYRLIIDQILPRDVSLAIYLDSDIVVNGDLSELFSYDLNGYTIAAVPDAWVDRADRIKEKIELPKGARYFNSGVLLINLETWRQTQSAFARLNIAGLARIR